MTLTNVAALLPALFRRAPRVGAVLCSLLLLPAGAAPALAALPEIGDPAGSLVPSVSERRLGEALLQELRRKGLVLDDAPSQAYLRALVDRLAVASGAPARSFLVFLVRDPSINAFAAPGGFIGIHTGLVRAARTESELAAVLAHEMAHVTQRHLARAFEEARRLSLPAAVTLLAAALIGTRDPNAGGAALAAGMAGISQRRINFTRAHEREADRIGIELLARAGLSPEGMPRFFERLARERRLYGREPPEFLSTHPVSTSRIADARARIAELPGGREDSLRFQLVRARIEALMAKDPADAVGRFRKAVASGTHASREAARYGLALALLRAGRAAQAAPVLRALARDDPDRILYRIDLARALTESGRVKEARSLLEATLRIYPSNALVLRALARTLLAAGEAARARTLLEPLARPGSGDPALHELYARAAEAAGALAQAHRAQAEVYFLNGQVEAAIGQLERALRLARDDYYEAERIRARLSELREQARSARH